MEKKKEEKNKGKFDEKGITLIALVVTIVVLLILAGISINLVLGDNGIIKKAKEAKTAQEQGWNNDIDAMDNYEKYIDESVNGNSEDEDTGDEVYAKLYDDGTLIFSSTDYTASDKNLAEDYGDISKNKCWFNEEKGIIEGNLWGWIDTKTFENKATSVIIYDKIRPINTSYWFVGYTGDSLDLMNLDTSNVTDMAWMFVGSSNLTGLDLSNFNTRNVTDMSHMFDSCDNLTKLDLSNFNTRNVTYMKSMFHSCNTLTKLDVSNFNTSNVTDMSEMFCGCNTLTELDVSNFNTSNVTDMSYMFGSCSALTELDVSNFNTSNVTDMSFMFNGCESTELNVSNFNTSNVTNMSHMFGCCFALTELDISNFDTRNVTDMAWMFNGCEKLSNIYVGENWNVSKADTSCMFYVCGTSTVTKK